MSSSPSGHGGGQWLWWGIILGSFQRATCDCSCLCGAGTGMGRGSWQLPCPITFCSWESQHLNTTVLNKKSPKSWQTHLAISAPCSHTGSRERHLSLGRIDEVWSFSQCFEDLSWWGISVTSGVHPAKQILGEDPEDPVQLSVFTHPWSWVFIFVFR